VRHGGVLIGRRVDRRRPAEWIAVGAAAPSASARVELLRALIRPRSTANTSTAPGPCNR
jgi:hypothetical protein